MGTARTYLFRGLELPDEFLHFFPCSQFFRVCFQAMKNRVLGLHGKAVKSGKVFLKRFIATTSSFGFDCL